MFWHALVNTVWWTFGSLAHPVRPRPGSGTALSEPFFGRRLVQALVFLPWAVPSFISGLAWAWLFNPIIGPLPHWLFAPASSPPPTTSWPIPHRHVGADHRQCLVGRAVLRDHAAGGPAGDPGRDVRGGAIDGAGPWRRFVHVTLPFLAPTIAITVLLRTIWISNFADLIVVMTGGGPANTTQILPSYIFTTAYKKLDFGYASAISMALLLLLFLYSRP